MTALTALVRERDGFEDILTNHQINYKAVYRTAQATPGLLKTQHQKAEADAKILVCLGFLKIKFFIPTKDFQKSTHAKTGYPPQSHLPV